MSLRDDDLNKVAGGSGGEKTTYYTVAKGDTLHSIARHYQHQGYTGVTWERVFDWNRDRIKNPDHIEVGWKLLIQLIR